MSFMSPNIPEQEIAADADPVTDEQRRRELAVQRARRRSMQTTRESLVIDPGTRADGDNGLSIRR